MSHKAFKIVLCVLSWVLLLEFPLTGCSWQGTGSKPVSGQSAMPPTAESDFSKSIKGRAFPYDTGERVEFTTYWNYSWINNDIKWGETIISRELDKIMNCKIEIAKPDGDPNERLNVMIASDSLPEVIILNRDRNYKMLIELGKLYPLDDYIERYPGYSSSVDKSTINLAKVNDKSYSILNWTTTTQHPTGNGGWMINEKIWKQMGSPQLKTFDDLFKYLTSVQYKHLNVYGKSVVPMQFRPSEKFDGLFQLYYSVGGLDKLATEDMVYVDKKNGQLKFFMTDPAWAEAMLFANKLWRADLINKDYFIETDQQKNDKRDSGRVAVYTSTDITSEARDGKNAWKETDPAGGYKIIEPIAGNNFRQEDIKNSVFTTLGWNSICITRKAKNPERIYGIFDFIASDEGQILTFHGPKGVLWDELDDKGFPIIKRNISDLNERENRDLGSEKYSLPGMAQWIDLSKIYANSRKLASEKDFIIEAQQQITWKHSADVTEFENIYTALSSVEGLIHSQVEDLVKKNIPKIVMAKDEAEVRKIINDTVEQAYSLGFEKVEKYKTSIWKENLKNMGK